jgi:zinc protease
MGLPILARHETDKIFPMFVANHIMGGSGFGSRLTREIRENRGLSYSVFSAFRLLQQKGPFFVGLQTGKESSQEAIEVMMSTVSDFIENGPTEQELQTAKQGLIGGFALRLDSNSKILENLSQIVFYNLPLDYLDNWTLRIKAVTLQDVKKVLKERLNLNDISLIVVGHKE